jgi:ABC-2 type transport system permease protein
MTAVALRDPGLRATVAAEWSKFASLRSVRVTLVLGTLLGVGVTALFCWLVLATWDDWPVEERAAFRPAEAALIGLLVTGTVFAVLGVTTVSSEYSSRMASLTFTVTPRRERVLLAKVLIVAVASFVATALAVVGMVVVARLMLARLDLPTPDALRVVRIVLGVAAGSALFSVVAVSVTFVVRSAAGSVAGLLALMFLPAILEPLLPSWWSEHAERYLIGAATDSLTLPALADTPAALDRGVAALVVAGWIGASVGLALVALDRRDV